MENKEGHDYPLQSNSENQRLSEKIISAQKGLLILHWLKENSQNPFTVDEVNKMFDVKLTNNDIIKINSGQFIINFPKFSYFRAPVSNTIPTKEIDLVQLHKAITGSYYKKVTEQYREIEEGPQKVNFKRNRFDHVTFSGTFKSRKTADLKQISGYAVFDFDHVSEIGVLKNSLINDEVLGVQLLFRSPTGDGLKMILFNDDNAPYSDFYNEVVNYIKIKHPNFGGYIDTKTKDVSRTCFICYDPEAYIKNQYLELWQASRN